MKQKFAEWIRDMQDTICQAVEKTDGQATFAEDRWVREEGGGGITRIISGGRVFEKGGVNTSEVYGNVTEAIRMQLKVEGDRFFACGLSLVLHPHSPMVPTVHANYRYFEVYDKAGKVIDSWFGGGSDLTPYYLFEADVRHFHRELKKSCDSFLEGAYEVFKKQCDNYFVNTHRDNERRGVGGIFYDQLKPTRNISEDKLFAFARANGSAFIDAYMPLVEKRRDMSFSEAQKHWQLIRRGRYVEFNLIHDRGTVFGLKSNGRTESILMSLPPEARFEYDYKPMADTEEEKLQRLLLSPIDWI